MKTQRKITKYLLVAAFFILTGFYRIAEAADWPNWRGPNHDGISMEKVWSSNWPEGGAKVLWKKSLGVGFSSIAVSNGRVYTMGNIDDNDFIYCFDAKTGKELWRHSYPEPKKAKNYEGGPNATPTVIDAKVYTMSKTGRVLCLDALTGSVVWKKSLKDDFGVEPPKWGLSGSAFVADDIVIYNAGTAGVALKKVDGSLVWQNGNGAGGYATAVPYTAGGQKCIAMFTSNEIVGLAAATGVQIWAHPWETSYNVNAADPIVKNDKVFISSGYNKGCALLKVNGSDVAELWRNTNMRNQFNSSVLWKGHIYGVDDKKLVCLDYKTGETKWSHEGLGKGSLMLADGKLIILGEKGKLVIAPASPDSFKELASAQILTGKCWTVPVLANSRIYARNAVGDLVCIDVSKKAAVTVSTGKNWAQWQGPNRDGKSTETGLLKKWPQGGPKMIWSAEGLGDGFSSVSIANGFVYTTGIINNEGVLSALDLHGNPKWHKPYGLEWTKSHSGTRGTPTVDAGSVYIVSGVGAVSCFDTRTGEKKWTVDTFSDFGGKFPRWGMAESPLLYKDMVICTPGGNKASMVALNKQTGKVVWTSESIGEKSSYCSPKLIQRGGKDIIVTTLENSIVGLEADTGKVLWSDSFGKKGINPLTPVYYNGCIYTTSGYGDGGVMYELSAEGGKITRKWIDKVLDNHHGGVVLVDGYIYGSKHKKNWLCLDWESGRVMYETDDKGKGSIIYADGMLYCYDENGTVSLVKPSPKGFEAVSSFKVTKGTDEHWAHPVICDGRLYIRHGEALMAYDIKAK